KSGHFARSCYACPALLGEPLFIGPLQSVANHTPTVVCKRALGCSGVLVRGPIRSGARRRLALSTTVRGCLSGDGASGPSIIVGRCASCSPGRRAVGEPGRELVARGK